MSLDAASLPSPPDFTPWENSNRPVPRGSMPPSGGASPNGNHAPPAGAQPPIFPNIKDLQDQAAALDVNEKTSISDLLRKAREAIDQARTLVDFDQLDKAYVHYLRASEITVNLIPRHPDYRVAVNQRPGWYKEFASLMMAVRTKQGTMDDIKHQIMEDNVRSNVPPTASPKRQSVFPTFEMPSAGTVQSQSLRGRQDQVDSNGFRLPSPSKFQQISQVQANLNRHSTPVDDVLAQRFARLRASPPEGSQSATTNGTNYTSGTDPMPSAEGSNGDYPPRPRSYMPDGSPQPSILSSPQRRPLGPRTMGTSHAAPALPPKVPLVTTSLPRAPDPAYSPIWSVPSQPQLHPPRTSTESSRPVNPRYSQLSNPNSPRGSPSRDDNPYRSYTPNGIHQAKELQSSTADLPLTPTVSAHDLLDYLRRYNVMLIDVRPRDQFDHGHVYAKSIICIEPVALKENVSAEELEERLVVSPEHEQSLFERRNEFDLVVYYDQSTSSISYLAGSPVGTTAPHLRALHDTLYEFNAYKPLKDGRPPALLLGGLDAWIDLLGQQSLATSSTAAVMGSLQVKRPVAKPGRPLGRVPTMVSANSSLEVRKRRLREYRPLNPEELTAWMEQSKVEEIDASAYAEEVPFTEEPEQEEGDEAQAPVSPFVHTYEDFLRRFPEPHTIQQSMVVPHVRPAGTSAPNYAASAPVVPSRPPPAVPRPSYSGVSEGRQIQPTLERQNSASKTALYTANSLLHRIKLPRTGLTNFGVTCYMNSTIQCLSATVMLSKFFLDNRFRYYIQKNWKGSQGVMPGLFANLVRSLWKNDVEVIKPTSFRNFAGRLNQEWAIDRQQDAKEFFDFVVDCLHEDLNINWQRNPLRPLTFEEEMQRERMPVSKVSKIEWDRYRHREESFISSLFAGQHASRLRCTTCKRTSTTYEAFYSISVEIPPSGTGDIYQCLRSYCQEEMLSGDEVWKCPYCKCERVATKQIIITRAPQILVVHFKRFAASKTHSARKIHTPIEFPLHGLRMDDFVFTTPNSSAPDKTGPHDPLSPVSPPFTYDAYGVLRHIGSSMGSGHYISLVRDAQRQCWRKFDDERSTDFNPRDMRYKDRLTNEQAYIVFYERVPAK
ncbi:putative ubiquitin C-terminal hydrolase [Aspergillus candidus]|uniref:Putative ubiquitin C-terminal hydrolase n=1 Tax=Aspergillus candidus TaxID=41067 RepID=A0A2I2F9J5_ASPCN|nr:putative ubiquitin C-terminal hydrolase [Aspergillus candidus]PLB37268.1 putative ubiquitin C-terminal hydrolase [Aspergillus candidus]